jgi:hypothetical protein
VLDTSAAWFGALLDGEGSIMLNKRTYSARVAHPPRLPIYRPVVVVAATTDYRLIDAISSRLGYGQVYEHAVSNTSLSHNPRKRRQWTYRLNTGQIPQFLAPVLPWLVLKTEQAQLLFEAIEIKRSQAPLRGVPWQARHQLADNRARLTEIYERIRALNTRGREVMPNVD